MAVTAVLCPRWLLRMGFVALVFAAFGIWCLYDARIAYPRFNRRAGEYNRLLAEGQAENWPQWAAEQGWTANFADDDRLPDGRIALKTNWDTGTQYLMLTACLVVVSFTLGRILRARGRSMSADEQGFVTVEGRRVAYPDVVDIDLRRWQRKSLARVSFRDGDRQLTTVIDDWIYRGGEAVLEEIRRHTGLAVAEDAPPQPATEPASPAAGTGRSGSDGHGL